MITGTENAIIKTLGNRFSIPLDFEFFKQPISPYYLHEDLVVTIKLSKPERVMHCSGDTDATYTISNISLKYDAIIDSVYIEKVSSVQNNSSYPYTRVTRLSLSSTVEERSFMVTASHTTGKKFTRVAVALCRGSNEF